MSFKKVGKITDKSFYWARKIKAPYLTRSEDEILLEELKKMLAE